MTAIVIHSPKRRKFKYCRFVIAKPLAKDKLGIDNLPYYEFDPETVLGHANSLHQALRRAIGHLRRMPHGYRVFDLGVDSGIPVWKKDKLTGREYPELSRPPLPPELTEDSDAQVS